MRKPQQGISLIELMVAMVVGLILVGGIITMFIEVRNNLSRTEKVAALTTEGQFAMATLSQDLALAGFWGRTFNPANILFDATIFNSTDPSITISSDCSDQVSIFVGGVSAQLAGAYNVMQPLDFHDGQSGANVNTTFNCLSSAIVEDGTDVIGIRRVAARPIATPDINPDLKHRHERVYLRANSGIGVLYQHLDGSVPTHPNTPTTTADAAIEDWAYQPSVYFIRKYSRQAGDGIPTLCQKVLYPGDPPYFSTECIAEGIENLQLELGIDSDADGVVNYFKSDPITDPLDVGYEMDKVASIRIFLLARSLQPQHTQNDKNIYTMAGTAFEKDDAYLREVYTMTIPLRNPARLRVLF